MTIKAALRLAYATGGSLPVAVPNVAENVTGGLHSPVGGRTDHLPISVPEGAYVIPADIVSALGQGNTTAGMKVLDQMFHTHSMPQGKGVDIAAAGGEYIVAPQVVTQVGDGNPKQGHAALDSFVKAVRKQNVNALRKMPGPVK